MTARELVMTHGWNATDYQILNPGIEHWFPSSSACGPAVPDLPASASRCPIPVPGLEETLRSWLRYRAARWIASPRWLPVLCRRHLPSCPSPEPDPPTIPRPRRIPSGASPHRSAAGCAKGSNDPASLRPVHNPGTNEDPTNQLPAKRYHVPNRYPRSSPPASAGSTCPASNEGRPLLSA